MKANALVIISLAVAAQLALLMPVSRADTPAKDPVVRELRERFKRARVPRPEDLAYGKSWECTYYSANPGSHERDTFGNYFTFLPSKDPKKVKNRFSVQAPYFFFAKKSLIGAYYNGNEIFSVDRVRVGDHGELLVEYTMPECDWTSCLFFGWVRDRAVDNYWAAILGYRECHVEE